MNHEYLYRERDDFILILSVMDTLEIGSETELEGEFGDKTVSIFARKILINGDVHCSNLLLSANEISSTNKGNIYLERDKEGEFCLNIYTESCVDLEKNIQIHVGDTGKVNMVITSQYRKAMLLLMKAYEENHYFNLIYALRDASFLSQKILWNSYKHMWKLYDSYDPDNEYPEVLKSTNEYQETLIQMCNGFITFYNQSDEHEQNTMKEEIRQVIEELSKKINFYEQVYEEELMREIIRSDRVRTSFCHIEQVDNPTEAANLAIFPTIHPVQSRMLLEKYKLFFAVNSMVNQKHITDTYKEILEGFQIVQNQMAVFQNPSSALTTLYENQKEALFYTLVQEENSHLYEESSIYIWRITQGYDYFGKKEIWVPRGSFSIYQSQMEKILVYFQDVELEYQSYLDKSKSHKQKIAQLQYSENQEEAQYQTSLKEKKELEKKLSTILVQIEQLKKALSIQKSVVLTGLQQIQDLIKQSFGCSVEDIISSLAMCAFAPGSKLLIGTQVGDLAVKSFTTVTGDSGTHINKKYLIHKIQNCSKDVKALLTSYKELEDGTLESEDKYENMILMNDNDIVSLIGTLEDVFPDKTVELKKEFKKFSNMALEQNQKILEYNECFLQIRKKQLEADSHKANKKMILTLVREEADPEAPQIAQYMSAIYQETQRKVIFELYKECRAFYYWSVNEITCVSEVLAKYVPYNLSCSIFKKLQIDLIAEQSNIIESQGIIPEGMEEQGIKIEYSLLENGRKDLIEKIKQDFTITFHMIPADKKAKLEENPFAKRANIRLIKMAAQAVGAKAESVISIDMCHFGDEIVYNKYGEEIRFSHDEIKNCCEYSKEEERNIYIQFDDKNHTYALVSPFAFWSITLDKDKHRKLNLENLEDIKIIFYVICESFVDG